MESFERELFALTAEYQGQYPRPWMTDLRDPREANCFIVGRNQRQGYDSSRVGSQKRHVDALLNRNGMTCRGLYDSMFDASPTRRNIDRLSRRLRDGGAKVLETNVICFSSPMSGDLSSSQRQQGKQIFRWLVDRISPAVIIVHGAGAAKDLRDVDTGSAVIIEMEALAPPQYNKWAGAAESGQWSRKSEERLDEVAAKALTQLGLKG